MIYAESFRHWVLEWIQIHHPSDDREWPWVRSSKLYLVNFYSVSGDPIERDHMPPPLISILINGIDSAGLVTDKDSLYPGYFDQNLFQLPRRYLFNPFVKGKTNQSLSRHDLSCDGYRDFSTFDAKFLSILADRKHIRHSRYQSDIYNLIRIRLHELADASHSESYIRYADNMLDATIHAADIVGRKNGSPDTMLIAAPLMGIMSPIKKSQTYRILNGALVVCKEPIHFTVDGEPSYDEYQKILYPFRYSRTDVNAITLGDTAKAVAYVAVETPNDAFTFQEYSNSVVYTDHKNEEYCYMISHNFSLEPYMSGTRVKSVRLNHDLQEGVMRKNPPHRRFLNPSRDETLFKRSDLPNGIFKNADGVIVHI